MTTSTDPARDAAVDRYAEAEGRLRRTEKLMRAVGRKDDADELRELHEHVHRALVAELVDGRPAGLP